MKSVAIIAVLFLTTAVSRNFSFAQETKTISKKKILPIECEINQYISSDNDTTKKIILSFKDARYPSLEEYEYIFLRNNDEIKTFVDGLSAAITYLDTADKNSSKSFSGKGCSFYASGGMILISTDGPHATMMKMSAKKLIAWLDTVKFP